MECFYVKDFEHAAKIFREFNEKYDRTSSFKEEKPWFGGDKKLYLEWKSGTGDCGFGMCCIDNHKYTRLDNGALKVFVKFWAAVEEDSCISPADIQFYIDEVKNRSYIHKWNGKEWKWERGDEN